MKMTRLACAALATLAFLGTAMAADEKTDIKKLIVGKWEATKAEEGTLPVGTLVEFTADGKLKLTMKVEGKELAREAKYVVEGSAFVYTASVEGKEKSAKITITSISESAMSTTNEQGKKVDLKKLK